MKQIIDALEAARTTAHHLQVLADRMDSKPGTREDTIQNLAHQVIDELDAALAAAREQQPVALTDDAIAARCSQLDSVRGLPNRCDEDLWPHVERAMLDIARLYAAPPAPSVQQPVRYAVNADTDADWHQVCDTTVPHINGVGDPIARALPDMAERIAALLNAAPPAQDAEDAARLDWLEAQINEHGAIHLHDGSKPHGFGLGLRPGNINRTLRQAIDDAARGSEHGR